jgi:hypothetical protein
MKYGLTANAVRVCALTVTAAAAASVRVAKNTRAQAENLRCHSFFPVPLVPLVPRQQHDDNKELSGETVGTNNNLSLVPLVPSSSEPIDFPRGWVCKRRGQ